MNPPEPGQFEWANQTQVTPFGVTALVILGLAVFILPRRWVIVPFLLLACFVSPAQRVIILSMNFSLLRLLLLAGWMRLIVRDENRGFGFKSLDGLVVVWALTAAVIYTIQGGSAEALKNRLGASFDAVGTYFLLRCLVRDWHNLELAIYMLCLIAIPVFFVFLLEAATGKNLFATFGYVPEMTIVRDGRLRCQGAFAHPILAGCFWASLLPLMLGLWKTKVIARGVVLAGIFSSLLIIYLCASSTPVVAVMLGILGWLIYPFRRYIRWIGVAALFVLIEIHLVRHMPLWHLISRTEFVGGSTGWHRYILIDQAINRFDEWWLWGTPSTAHWGTGLFDVTNQYVLEGVRGGALTLLLFLIMIGAAFKSIGRFFRFGEQGRETMLSWGLGVSLFVQCMSFLAVSYFGQIWLIWYLVLASVGSLVEPISKPLQKGVIANRSTTGVPALGVPAGKTCG